MIKLENLTLHDEMCGGASYSGKVMFDGKTVKEVLEEIKEFAKDKQAQYIGKGFGNPLSKGVDCWGIRINDKNYVGGWAGWKENYDHEYDNSEVERIVISGGWYCFYDFHIITKDYRE